jgi:processing peptidase subunit alpha
VRAAPRVESRYVGGNYHVSSESETIYFYLCFEGVSWRDPNYFAAAVLTTLIGQGGGFSSGRPGEGMHSRSYTHILPKYPFINSNSDYQSFSDSGLFNIKVIGLSTHATS